MNIIGKTEDSRTEDRGDEGSNAPLAAGPRDNRSLFIGAMANPIRRRIAFDVVERNCRIRFRVGEEGIKTYLQLLTYVQSSKVDEAVDEFEKRFVSMLNQRLLKRMLAEGRITPLAPPMWKE
jgi:hypothetical protein